MSLSYQHLWHCTRSTPSSFGFFRSRNTGTYCSKPLYKATKTQRGLHYIMYYKRLRGQGLVVHKHWRWNRDISIYSYLVECYKEDGARPFADVYSFRTRDEDLIWNKQLQLNVRKTSLVMRWSNTTSWSADSTSCRIFICGDIQNLIWHKLGHLIQMTLLSSGGWTRWSPEVPANLSCFVIWSKL